MAKGKKAVEVVLVLVDMDIDDDLFDDLFCEWYSYFCSFSFQKIPFFSSFEYLFVPRLLLLLVTDEMIGILTVVGFR